MRLKHWHLIPFLLVILGCHSRRIEPQEAITWKTHENRPDWINREPYVEGEFLFFVGLSEIHATEKEAREIALRDAAGKAAGYAGRSVRDEFRRVQKSHGVSSDIINPETSTERVEEQLSKSFVTRMKAREYYSEKSEARYPDGSTKTGFKSIVLSFIPKAELDREISEAVRRQEELNLSAARALEIFSGTGLGRANFSVEVWPDKGNNAVYKEGEEMSFNFRASRDCFVYLYLLDAAGDVIVLFPYGNENNYVKGNHIYTIPPKQLNLSLQASAPFGNETVKAFASLRQIPELRGKSGSDEEVFYGIGKIYGDRVKDIVRAIKVLGPENLGLSTK